jgi:hypothetical protein
MCTDTSTAHEPITPEYLAQIRERDSYFDTVTVGQLTGDRRALLAEIDRLTAQVRDLAGLLDRAASESAGLFITPLAEDADHG